MAIRSLNTGSFSRSLLVGNSFYDPYAYKSIATISVGAGGAGYVEFTSIPSTYTHLQIRCITLDNQNLYSVITNFNSDTGSNYSWHVLYGTGSLASAGGAANETKILSGVGSVNTASYPAATVIDILDYANTNKYKTLRSLTGADGNGSGQIKLLSGLWRSTSAINTIKITAESHSFNQYSRFALYGIRSA